jgi:hypothetical protein
MLRRAAGSQDSSKGVSDGAATGNEVFERAILGGLALAIIVTAQHLEQIPKAREATYPHEYCGLLLGHVISGRKQVSKPMRRKISRGRCTTQSVLDSARCCP